MSAQPFGKLVYLASPLTHKDETVRQERSRAAAQACGWLMSNYQDIHFFSPVVYTHLLGSECTLPYQWEFWAKLDECMISRCQEIWVLTIPGFKTSVGVSAEREIAKRLGVPIKFVVRQGDSYTVTDTEPEDVTPKA
jgi:hypothetical protein